MLLRLIGITGLMVLSATQSLFATTQYTTVKSDPQHVQNWNQFADALYQRHQQTLQEFSIRTTEELGGYSGLPEFYKEVRYYDEASDRLLSIIRWEQEKPATIHTIEIFVYDKKGRVERDYLAAYLPEFRNAPIQTLINLHHYSSELHGYRQFDASGNRIYEQCQGKHAGQRIHISLEEDDLETSGLQYKDITTSQVYLSCFSSIPTTVGQWIKPGEQ